MGKRDWRRVWDCLQQYRTVVLASLHAALLLVSAVFSFLVSENFRFGALEPQVIGIYAIFSIFLKFPIFYLFEVNRRSWRYSSVEDMLTLGKTITLAHLVFAGVLLFSGLRPMVTASVLVLDYVFALLLIGGVRLGFRYLYETTIHTRRGPLSLKKRVLIVGAGDGGAALFRKLRVSPKLNVEVVGFLDDDRRKHGKKIYGVNVFGGLEALEALVERLRVSEVYIAIPSLKKAELKRVTDYCIAARVQFRTIPSVREILDMNSRIENLRKVRVEDLLGREPIQLDKSKISDELRGQVVLVSGAGGSIGSELCRQILKFGPKSLILLDRSEYNLFHIERELRKNFPSSNLVALVGDILDKSDLWQIFGRYRPAYVYHAAAFKHVPLMEVRAREAVKNNVLGTRNLADAALEFYAHKFVMISTDKAVRPLSVMGFSKRFAELVVQSRARRGKTKFMSVRFGNVLGSSGSVLEVFRKQLQEGGPLTVTHPEVRRFFMTTPEAVELVLHSAAHGETGAIYMLEMGEPVKIMDLAKKVIELADPEGKKDIRIEMTGLRPGEKLTEELLWEGEDLVPSGMKYVAMLKNKVSVDGLDLSLRRLESSVDTESCDFEFELKAAVRSIDQGQDPVEYKEDSIPRSFATSVQTSPSIVS